MAYFISGLILLLVAAIISINYKNRKIKELEEDYRELEDDCKQLNDDLQTVSVLACNTENKNTNLQGEIDFRDRKIEALTGEDLESVSELEREIEEELNQYNEPVVVFNTISKKPETNKSSRPVNDLDKYDVKIAIHELEKGKK